MLGCISSSLTKACAAISVIEPLGIFSLIIALLFFMCTLGAKSSNGSVVLCMAGVFLLIQLLKKQSIGKTLTLGLFYLGIFIIVSKIFLIDGDALSSDSSSHKMVLSLVTAVRNPLGHKIFVILSGFLGQHIAYVIAFCVFCIAMHYIIVPLFLYAFYVILILFTNLVRIHLVSVPCFSLIICLILDL